VAKKFIGGRYKNQQFVCRVAQVPWGVGAGGESITKPAWRAKPNWYLVATEDRMIPPPAQRAMSKRAGSTVVEVAASHAHLHIAAGPSGRTYRAGRKGRLGGRERKSRRDALTAGK
jgi:hypothetical protein